MGRSDQEPETKPPFIMERFGRIEDMDRSFDVEYWQRQGPEAIFRAALEMVQLYLRHKGLPDDLSVDRSIESFQRTRG